jgi:polyhydroxybutyrate depolymerase
MLLRQIGGWVPSMRLSHVTLLAIASIVCVGGGPPARAEEIRIDTTDGARSAVVLRAPRRPAPTVMVLHGAGGSPERVQHRFGFADAAAKHGFAAVFPQGLNRQWNDGREFRRSGVDDVSFLKRLALTLVSSGLADAAHLYIAGVSNGGMMTFRVLCEWVELFAGAATIVASMPEEVGDNCRIEKPLPVIMFNGTADPVVPYAGGGVGFRGRRGNVWAAERTAAFLAHSNGCREASKMPASGRPAGSRCRQGGQTGLVGLRIRQQRRALPHRGWRPPGVRTRRGFHRDPRPRHQPGVGAGDHLGRVRCP